MIETITANKPRVLVVDDEEGLVLIMAMRLEFYGYEVISAFNGEEAIKKAKAHRPHVILLDVLMPVMNGWQCCEILKSDDTTKQIPIIVLTAYRKEDLQTRFQNCGANHLVQKPGDQGELMNQIRQIC